MHAVAVTSDGYACASASSRSSSRARAPGRRYARPAEGAEVVGVATVTGDEILIAATAEARGMLCKADEVNFLSGPGKGVILIKLDRATTACSAFIASTGDRDLLTVETTRGGEQTISTASTRSPAAAARAASCCSAASSPASSGRRRRRPPPLDVEVQ